MKKPAALVASLALVPLAAGASVAENWERHVVAEGFNCQTAVAADFTGDGLVDVIADAQGETRLFIAPDWKAVTLDRGHDTIHSEVLDVDGDGDPDYLGAVYSPGPIFWLERPFRPEQDEWPFHLIDEDVDGTHGLIVADVDGDGKPDLAGNSAQPKEPYPNSLVWWKVPPEPRRALMWIRHVFAKLDAPGLSHYLGVGDMNNDGVADIASAGKDAPEGNWFAWWQQPPDGSMPWKKHLIAENQHGATNILPADVNGDSHPDFIASRGHGQGALWMEGPDFRIHEINPDLVGPHNLAVGDIDGDGDVDAVTAAKDSFVVAWFENDGKGSFTTRPIYDDQAGYDIRLVDMDGDGDPDVLVAGQNSENVVWYENKLPR